MCRYSKYTLLWLTPFNTHNYSHLTTIFSFCFSLNIWLLCTAKKSLQEIRQAYFKVKNRVFAKARFGVVFSAQAMEEILKEMLGDIRMFDVQKPKYVLRSGPIYRELDTYIHSANLIPYLPINRVLIAAVNKSTTNPELHFFNNCFGDEFSERKRIYSLMYVFPCNMQLCTCFLKLVIKYIFFCSLFWDVVTCSILLIFIRMHKHPVLLPYRTSLEGCPLHVSFSHILWRVRKLCGRRCTCQQPLRLWIDGHSELLPHARREAASGSSSVCRYGRVPSREARQGGCAGVSLLWETLVQTQQVEEQSYKSHISPHKCCK